MTLPRLLADVSQDAAVNVENQTVDKVGSLRGEEHSGTAQILGLAPALGKHKIRMTQMTLMTLNLGYGIGISSKQCH